MASPELLKTPPFWMILKKLIKEYENDSHSITSLAKKYDCSFDKIKRILLKNNVKLRNRIESRNTKITNKYRHLPKLKIKQIVKLYTSGYGLTYISKFMSCHRDVIKYILNKNNIKLRTFSESIAQAGKLGLQRKTMMEKYGVTNCMHINEIRMKQFRNSFLLKEFILNGKKFEFQGYEDKAIRILVEERGYNVNDIDNENVPKIDYVFNGNNHCYFPDIYIKKENKIIEVKSQFTYMKDFERNQAKFKKVKEDGYDFELMIL